MAEWAGAGALRRAIGEERGAARSLALRLGRDPSAVHRWLRGARPDPTLWPEIERALNLPTGELRTWDATRSSVSQTDGTTSDLARQIAELQAKVDRQEERLGWLIQRLSLEELEAMNATARAEQFAAAAEGSTGEPRTVGRRVSRPQPPPADD